MSVYREGCTWGVYTGTCTVYLITPCFTMLLRQFYHSPLVLSFPRGVIVAAWCHRCRVVSLLPRSQCYRRLCMLLRSFTPFYAFTLFYAFTPFYAFPAARTDYLGTENRCGNSVTVLTHVYTVTPFPPFLTLLPYYTGIPVGYEDAAQSPE